MKESFVDQGHFEKSDHRFPAPLCCNILFKAHNLGRGCSCSQVAYRSPTDKPNHSGKSCNLAKTFLQRLFFCGTAQKK